MRSHWKDRAGCVGCARRAKFVAGLMELVDRLLALEDANVRPAFESDAGRMYDDGWSVDDAVQMFLAHEELSPERDEDVCCAIMARLQAKYDRRKTP